MAKVFFHKFGVNNQIVNSAGVRFSFEKLADAQGVIALDEELNAADVSDLRLWIKKRLMGVSEITEEQYDEIKKNLSLEGLSTPRSATDVQVRLFTQQTPLEAGQRSQQALASAALAADRGVVEAVAERSHAESVTGGGQSNGRTPRVGRAGRAAAAVKPVSATEAETATLQGRSAFEPVAEVASETPVETPPVE